MTKLEKEEFLFVKYNRDKINSYWSGKRLLIDMNKEKNEDKTIIICTFTNEDIMSVDISHKLNVEGNVISKLKERKKAEDCFLGNHKYNSRNKK